MQTRIKLVFAILALTLATACSAGDSEYAQNQEEKLRAKYEAGYEAGYDEGFYSGLEDAADYIQEAQQFYAGEEALTVIEYYFYGEFSASEAKQALKQVYELWNDTHDAAIDLRNGNTYLLP